jgi:hypothetical protein
MRERRRNERHSAGAHVKLTVLETGLCFGSSVASLDWVAVVTFITQEKQQVESAWQALCDSASLA